MTMIAQDKALVKARASWLRHATGSRNNKAVGALLLDTVAAIGFGGALAGGIAAAAVHALVWPWAIAMVVAGLARGLFAAIALRHGAEQAGETKRQQRAQVVANSLYRRAGGTDDAGLIATRVVDAVEALDGYVARFLPARRAAAIAPILVLAAIACASWFAALVLAGTLLPFVFVMILVGGAAAEQSRRQFAALSRLSGHFGDRIRMLPIILAFRAEDRETAMIGRAAHDLAHRTLRVLRVAFLSSAALEFFAALSVALVAVYCGFSLLGLLPFTVPETLSLAEAFFVLALAPEFYAPMRRLAAAYHDKQAAETGADALMALPPAFRPDQHDEVAGPLIFDNVTIRYPNTDRPAVSNLSFGVQIGETVALLGASGSGKSSLLHLLLGLAPLSSGNLIGADGAFTSIAGQASWMGQHPLLVAGTIRDNLLLANPNAEAGDLERAIAAAGLTPMLSKRADGLDTVLDARGSGLSGGERRRLALARALLKPAPFLLLDEPTAHLDTDSEAALIPAIARAAEGRTTLIATHSPAVAAIASRVIMLGGSA